MKNKKFNPYINRDDSTVRVMTDVVIALIPVIIIMWFGYEFEPIKIVVVSVVSALLTEFLFNRIFSKNTISIGDGSSIVTGILLACTLGPFTPLPVVVVGGVSGVLFGKMLWGGLGKNRFNPALIGREFMVVLFPAIMNSKSVFSDPEKINYTHTSFFNNDFWDKFIFNPSGAIGEYSPLLLVIGGAFLLLRRRISWHIPFSMLISFTIMLLIFKSEIISFTLGGLLLGTIYMATDMPTSSSTHMGKLYFGFMTGVCAVICILLGANRGYFSYSILLMNAFVVPINWIFRPRTWGKSLHFFTRVWQSLILTAGILASVFILLWFHNQDKLIYPVMGIAIYSILRFIFTDKYKPWGKFIKIRTKLF